VVCWEAALPPVNYLEEGTDLPQSAALVGATGCVKRRVWYISSPASMEG
jgi:hypothetical protein